MPDAINSTYHEALPDYGEITTLPPQIQELLFEKDRGLDIPRFHVVLLDDAEHTYDYVIDMLMTLFGHDSTTAFQMACEVDVLGRVVVYTTNRELAELKREQILKHGPDWRIEFSTGSMRATLEPVDKGTDLQQ